LYILGLAQIIQSGCIKSEGVSGSAALTIVNAIDSSTSLVPDFEPFNAKGLNQAPLEYFASASQIGYASYWEEGSYVGSVSLSLCDLTDTLRSLWKGTLDLPNGSIHTLFLSGDTSSVDTLLTTDVIPYYPLADSVAGVRFINLSKGSLPMTVNLQGNLPGQTEFSNLEYRQISSFKQYLANSSAPANYTFEIRDQATGTLLCTAFQWVYTPFDNYTLAIAGSENPSGTTPITIIQVDN